MPPIPYAPTDYLRDMVSKGLEAPLASEGRLHLMGTEENGADVLSRMIHACRISLSIGLIASGIALFIGVIVGGLMGYFSGLVDMLGMRLVEIFEDIPTLFLLLTFVAFFGRSLYMMMVIIGVTGWSGYARYVRQEFLKLRKQDYVQAAVASGLPLTFHTVPAHAAERGGAVAGGGEFWRGRCDSVRGNLELSRAGRGGCAVLGTNAGSGGQVIDL